LILEELGIVPLDKTHNRVDFSCGEESLDRYLRERATQDHKRSLARCYVLIQADSSGQILGYYTLSAHSVRLEDLPRDMAKGVPYGEVPSVLIGRLAIDITQQGMGLGEHLLAAAVEHCTRLETELGLRVVVVDALSERAAQFYERFGFRRFSPEGQRLFLNIKHF
jgi:predicted GNAT family N-acyltransferase